MSGAYKIGDTVERVMVVAKKVRRDFTGGKFLLFQFSDREGVLKGVYWDPSFEAETKIKVDDIVRVKGEIQDYQGSMQLKVNWIEKLDENEYNPAVFLPVTSRDTDQIYDDILKMIASVNNEHIRALLQTIYGTESFRKDFLTAPAAKGWHHSYIGGLAEHVYDMATIANDIAEVYREADRDLLLAGVLLHDIGKLEELSVTNHIHYSDRGRLLGHICLGVEFLDEYLRGLNDFPPELETVLKHLILSHHGKLEHGSPVVPMTIEALLLNYIDNLDAQIRGALMELEKGGPHESSWTNYVKLLDRFIYRGQELEGTAAEGEDDG
ncbi:MAG: HD domain-containing protein [Candidatus Krumholzibacteriota bacterium]|nr:HD domain-containing protein [Candidatus Krumholzibacteriota bacterium]